MHLSDKTSLWIVILLVIFGGFLRFYNLNWDQGYLFHPDERNIANAVTKIHFFKNLDPEFFAYGGFTIYLYRLLAEGIKLITHQNEWVSEWGRINLIGRVVQASFATSTIFLVYLLAKKLFSKKVGILSCFLYAFTAYAIQAAHFATTESILAASLVAITLCSILLYDKPNKSWAFILGILCGIALASKTTAIAFLLPPLLTYILLISQDKKPLQSSYLYQLVVFIIVAVGTFTIFSPYTFINWNKFSESMRYESGVATGTLPVVYTYQFNNTLPYIYQSMNLFWQMGPIFILALLGIVFLIWVAMTSKKNALFIFLVFPICYFAYIGYWHTKFVRYMAPLLPFFVISASALLFAIPSRFGKRLLITLACLSTSLFALAFFSIYIREQTKITATKWIYNHIPADSFILQEHWDHGLPIPLEEKNPTLYTIEQLTLYEPDDNKKSAYLAQRLAQGDYIEISSRRLYGTLLHMKKQYPITSHYYELLFSGRLGYNKIAEFSSYPSLFGIQINDDQSEESFQVFDHAKILIFQNKEHLSESELTRLLTTQ